MQEDKNIFLFEQPHCGLK